MTGWAIALLHLDKEQFGLLRLPEFWAAMSTHAQERDAERRHIGELVRGAALRLWNLQVKRECQVKDPALFWWMPWDEPTADENIRKMQKATREEKNQAAAAFLNRLKDNG